ncbi:RNA-binding protein 25 [Podospora fimiseda]|uniref:RNA-binding protein 25 n=1 Tax=Podospora fimiseda TaxID=252190 RepID=A0AAN6YU32_9PEZI|nr:RNA-binding protein 25 [Podospora fimiseda]
MAYNPYGAPPYGAPPTYGAYPGATHVAPGMAPPPGLGPPPGMSSAPGMAPAPGVQQLNPAAQANRPSGLPPSFQPPPNLPNINFNAPVIRLGALSAPTKPGNPSTDRRDSQTPTSARPGLGSERNVEQSRAQMRETMQSLVPPTPEERLRTIFVHKIPNGVGGEEGIQKLLRTVGVLRRWDSAQSHLTDHKGDLFGFAQYEDPESLVAAVELLKDIEVPLKKQFPIENPPADNDDKFENIEKVKLQVEVDQSTVKYIESWKESLPDDSQIDARLAEAKQRLKQHIRDLFYPRTRDADGDTAMGGANSGENVEVINISLAPEDELADIPPEMRATVAAEIAAFRERSNRRDLERLRKEEEFEEMERQRNGAPRKSRLDSPPPSSSNNIPLGPRGPPGAPNAPTGPRGQNRVDFVSGGTTNTNAPQFKDDDDTDADDEERWAREVAKQRAEEEKIYLEAERKWVNRERQRNAALERERAREKDDTEGLSKRIQDQLEKDKNWDDDKENARKVHLYYRDHSQWIRERSAFRSTEAGRDEEDRRAEAAERRRADADMAHAKDMADSFLDRQAKEMKARSSAPVAPQRVTISFGAAAQRVAQKSATTRRTVAEVEGLLDNEENEATTKRRLVPIKFEPITDTKTMSEEDIQNAVRALAQEIPVDKEGLWAWDVKWDYLEEAIIREKLRPFVEKKVVEYLGVQEQFLVDVVEEHLRKHQKPAELVETLGEALDEDAEDLVKKLWRMVIFFTESEKRGLPA